MSTVTVLTETVKAPLPPGVNAQGGLEYRLFDMADPTIPKLINDFTTVDTTVPFPGVPPGTYQMTVQRLDDTGGPLGNAVSVDIVVAADTFDQPVRLSVVSITPDPTSVVRRAS